MRGDRQRLRGRRGVATLIVWMRAGAVRAVARTGTALINPTSSEFVLDRTLPAVHLHREASDFDGSASHCLHLRSASRGTLVVSLPVSGGEAFGSVTRFCTECGQCLVLPTVNLARSFRCPRCGSTYVAGALVDTATPVAAVPSSDRVASPPAAPIRAEVITPPTSTSEEPRQAPSATRIGPAPAASQQVAGTQTKDASGSGEKYEGPGRVAKGAAIAASTASSLVTLADKVDSRLYGWRAKVVVGAAAAVVFPPTLARWIDNPLWLQPLTILCFVALVLVLALARVAMFRSEDGSWAPSLGVENAQLALVDFWGAVEEFKNGHPKQRARTAGSFLVGAALVSLAIRAATDSLYNAGFDSWSFDWTEATDWTVFWLGVGLWAWATRATRRDGKLAALVADPEKDRGAVQAVAQAFAGLPVLVDCRDHLSAEAFTGSGAHPLVARLLRELSTWHPRRADTEKPYQHSLYRKLRGAVPEADPQLEVPLRSQGLPFTGRIDILLGRCVLVEIKRRLTTSTAQKALGQIEMYVRIWQHNGPVVLVLCDTDPILASAFFGPALMRLRSAGHSGVAVLAAS